MESPERTGQKARLQAWAAHERISGMAFDDVVKGQRAPQMPVAPICRCQDAGLTRAAVRRAAIRVGRRQHGRRQFPVDRKHLRNDL